MLPLIKSKIEQFKEIIKSIDTPPKQILVEASIVEIERNSKKEVGIDWSLLGDLFSSIDWRVNKTQGKDASSSFSLGMDVRARLDNALKILDERGDIKLRASPKIITINNKPGEFFSGVSDDYYMDEKAGIRLKVTPVIGSSNMMTLEILAGVGDLVSSRWDYSLTNEQSVNSTILVKNNETIVIGGLKRKFTDKKTRRFPLLGYILPGLFSREISVERESELLFFVTPSIIETPQMSPEEIEKLKE